MLLEPSSDKLGPELCMGNRQWDNHSTSTLREYSMEEVVYCVDYVRTSFRLSCDQVQSNLLNKSILVNGTNKTSLVQVHGISYCANAKSLIPALSRVHVVCPTAHLAVNGPRATVITFNIVTSKDFQPMITAIPFYRVFYEPYKVVLHSISREKGSKYAGYINGDLVIRLSPLNQLFGNESDKIIIDKIGRAHV